MVRLLGLPLRPIAGMRLHRVVARTRGPWWFASTPGGGVGGRFDLPAPDGACYLSTSAVGAVLEVFSDLHGGRLPVTELRARCRIEVIAPLLSPPAADLAAARARGVGVTAALWAGQDRALTQRWARALFRAGWRALHTGLQHDPRGRLRGVTLLDQAGEHLPWDDVGWQHTTHRIDDDQALMQGLDRFGITVRGDVDLPVVRPSA